MAEQEIAAMKPVIQWLVLHLLFWALLYAAFGLELVGAVNLLLFSVWLLALFSFLFYLGDENKVAKAKSGSPS